METTLAGLLKLYAFTTGRRLFAMAQVKKAATDAGFKELADHTDVCIAYDSGVREIEARWDGRGPRRVQFGPEVRAVDLMVDGVLGAIHDTLQGQIKGLPLVDPLAASARKLLAEVFPKGLVAVTSKAFVEELAQVDRIVGVLQAPAWGPTVKDLGLSHHVTRLVDLAKQYRAVLDVPPKKMTYDEVKEARAKGQQLMLQAVAMILGRHPSDSDADQAGRAALLTPVLRQNEAIRQALRAKRPVEDVDPGTGEPVPAPAEGAKPVATPVEADEPAPASAAPV
jgi:hypothetical protein